MFHWMERFLPTDSVVCTYFANIQLNFYVYKLILWPRNTGKRGICYNKVCPSVRLSVTLVSLSRV